MYTHTHTHTYTCIYIYNPRKTVQGLNFCRNQRLYSDAWNILLLISTYNKRERLRCGQLTYQPICFLLYGGEISLPLSLSFSLSLSIYVYIYSFFQAAVVSILLNGCTTWRLTNRKRDGNYIRMLRAILNKSRRQHPTKQQLNVHLPPVTKNY